MTQRYHGFHLPLFYPPILAGYLEIKFDGDRSDFDDCAWAVANSLRPHRNADHGTRGMYFPAPHKRAPTEADKLDARQNVYWTYPKRKWYMLVVSVSNDHTLEMKDSREAQKFFKYAISKAGKADGRALRDLLEQHWTSLDAADFVPFPRSDRNSVACPYI